MKKKDFKKLLQELCDKTQWGTNTPETMQYLLEKNEYVIVGKKLVQITESGQELFRLAEIEVE